MAMKIRLARGGSKKRPFYRIVAADSRMPRDGRFIEKLGTYNPLLPKDSEVRVTMNMDRINYWLGEGAQPTDRISRMLEAAGAIEKKDRNNPQKAKPGQKAKDRAQEKADKLAAAEEAPAAEAAAEPQQQKQLQRKPQQQKQLQRKPQQQLQKQLQRKPQQQKQLQRKPQQQKQLQRKPQQQKQLQRKPQQQKLKRNKFFFNIML